MIDKHQNVRYLRTIIIYFFVIIYGRLKILNVQKNKLNPTDADLVKKLILVFKTKTIFKQGTLFRNESSSESTNVNQKI